MSKDRNLTKAQVKAKSSDSSPSVARTADKANAALKGFQGAVGVACELADPASVRSAVATIKAALGATKLDAIIANAGIMALPKNEQAFGIELQFFTNHVGHFIFVTDLETARKLWAASDEIVARV